MKKGQFRCGFCDKLYNHKAGKWVVVPQNKDGVISVMTCRKQVCQKMARSKNYWK